MPVGFVAAFCSDWQPATQQGISPSWEVLLLQTPFQNPPERSALVVLCCWWGKGLGSLLLDAPASWGAGPPGQPHPKRWCWLQGHLCSSLKPCASLEGVGTCPFPSDPVLEQKTGGSLELYRLETQRVFPLLPEQRQYGLILESRKVSSKLSENKGGEAHSLKLGFSWGSTGRPRQSPRAFLVGGSPVASLPTRDRTLAPRPRVGRAES